MQSLPQLPVFISFGQNNAAATILASIAFLNGASGEDIVTLLPTGVLQNGQRLRPPMPIFHMSKEDAERRLPICER